MLSLLISGLICNNLLLSVNPTSGDVTVCLSTDVDLVASDIVAGLFLLRWQTKQWVGTGHRIPLSLIYQDTSPSDLNVDILVKGDQNSESVITNNEILIKVVCFVRTLKSKYLHYNFTDSGSMARYSKNISNCRISNCSLRKVIIL
uniref:Uncharacterized protein n=1 Tax=Schistosoma haematobium TaxID=6185 RepID=A0A094ZZR1_SCHHA